MAKRIGIGLCHPKLSLESTAPGNWSPSNFFISPAEIGEAEMLDSCVAPPSRYLLEMYRRIEGKAGLHDSQLLVNPLPLLRKDELLVILATLRQFTDRSAHQAEIVVFCDRNNRPLAYLLPRSLIDDARFLILLSCSDAALDVTALAAFYSCAASLLTVDISISTAMNNGFYGGKYLQPNEVACRHAIEVLKAHRIERQAQDDDARRRCRDEIPLFAFISHHAGDVLFAIVASRVASGIFQGMAVHQDYAAICEHAGLALALLTFSGPVVHRGGYSREDPEHFVEMLPALPRDRFYVYARTSRDYNSTDHHLIDHYSYLLGSPMTTPSELNGGRPTMALATNCPSPLLHPTTRRILLHFGAGWPLKIYPAKWQLALVEQLRQRGYQATLLDAAIDIPGCRNLRFESIEQFEALLAEHQVLIGMDSFPAHYASLWRRIPTLCLFSSTHPVHSRTERSPWYQWMSEELGCAPCRAYQQCPRFGGEVCRNFSPPEEVCRHVEALLKEASTTQGETHGQQAAGPSSIDRAKREFKGLPSATVLKRLRPDRSALVRFDPDRLDYRTLHRNYRLMANLRTVLRVLGLSVEYLVAVRDQGFWRANALTREYLTRTFRRVQKHDDR